MLLLLLVLSVIAFAVYAASRTPVEERGRAWPPPAGVALVLLALPGLLLIAFFAPWVAALACLGLAVAWWLRARPPLPSAADRPRRRSRR